MKMGQDELKLDINTARALKENVQDSLERENRSKHLTANKRGVATPRNVAKNTNGDVFGMYGTASCMGDKC